jgi:hypothetical protein
MEKLMILWTKLLVKLNIKGKPPGGRPSRVIGISGIGPSAQIDPWKLARAIKKNGGNTLGFELSAEGFFDSTSHPSKAINNVLDRVDEWATACWANGIFFLCQLANAKDFHKPQVTRIWPENPQAWEEFTKQVAQRLGTKGVLFQPTLEDSDDDQKLVAAIANAYPGPPKIYNRGATPKTLPAGWDWLDYHPHRTTDKWPDGPKVIVQTDSPIGQQLRDGAKPKEYNPQQVGDYAKKVLASEASFLHFGFDTHNVQNLIDCMKAIGKALK